jgi:hypothetical protein
LFAAVVCLPPKRNPGAIARSERVLTMALHEFILWDLDSGSEV